MEKKADKWKESQQCAKVFTRFGDFYAEISKIATNLQM
jgi:hypothetical protein